VGRRLQISQHQHQQQQQRRQQMGRRTLQAAAAEAAAAAGGDEAEAAEIRALLEEENVTALPYGEGDSNAAALQELDALTGLPRADDVLMYAVPVCGPYAALVSYKYKVRGSFKWELE
jgi:hypothetical protein